MYGWRGRIAIIVGKRNAVCEPEFSKMVPTGVSVYAARTGTHTALSNHKQSQDHLEDAS